MDEEKTGSGERKGENEKQQKGETESTTRGELRRAGKRIDERMKSCSFPGNTPRNFLLFLFVEGCKYHVTQALGSE